MTCANCGTQNDAGRRFCDECGASLAAPCPNCGATDNRPSAKFCGTCGATLNAAAGQAATPAGAGPTAAERRFVSVLFVDLVGFTPFAEERDAEAVRDTLDKYFNLARLAVERHGGVIEKFIGDAVMAVWGTPTAHEDDAERAVRAAFELVDAARGLGDGVQARAGIVTGEAAVTIGAEGQGMVAGDMVNTASRLQSVAPAGSVLVSESTMNATKAAIAYESVGAQELKGKTAPFAAYRALRVVANRGGGQRSEGLEAPFSGRDEELRLLKELLHATTRDGRARIAAISGPAGIGKSRLTWEFEKYIDGVIETIYWHRGRSPAYGEGVTFWALGEMIRRRAELAEIDDEATSRARISATVAQYVTDSDERAWVEPALLTLLGLEPPPPGGRDALFAAWRIFFERIADQGTAVLVFEDIQWADSGLLDFIEHMLEWSKSKPIFVVALTRPELYERKPGWGTGHRLATQMPLEPLPEAAMRQLLAGLAPGLPDQAVTAILNRADGIPLYAVETIRMLVADGRLTLSDGAYTPSGDLGELAVPETLRSLIASRLDALDPTDRTLIQDGAVLGQRFTTAALAAISGMNSEEIEPRLRALVRREFLELEADPRSPERGQYGFVQSLIREVAYGTLARRDRRSRHLAAARYFETLADDELAGVLASHYLAAHEASEAGPEADALAVQARLALRGAAERAAALGSHQQALDYLEQALAVTTDAKERVALLELAAESANASGQEEKALRFARDALALHQEARHRPAELRTTALLGRILVDYGHMDEAVVFLEGVIAGAAPDPDGPEMADVLANLSRVYMRLDRNQESIDTADRALKVADLLNLELIVTEALTNKASSLHRLGRLREALALHQAAVALADRNGYVGHQLRGRNNLSVAQIENEPERGLQTVYEGIDLARRVGQRGMFNWLVGTCAMYSASIGHGWDRALEQVEETLASSPSQYDRARATMTRNLLLALRGDRLDELVPEAAEAAEGITDGQVIGGIDYLRAQVALAQGRPSDAHSLAVRALDAWPDAATLVLQPALHAAAMTGRIADVIALKRLVDADPRGTETSRGARMWADALVYAFDGRPQEGLRCLRAAYDTFHAIGLQVDAATLVIDGLWLFPGEPEVRSWVPAARTLFENLGAAPYLRMLDAALAAAEEKAPRVSPLPVRGPVVETPAG
ncbi:MAG TPA: adenylate/guanylate cyclase domain-containing protein [Candidatus Limnocylindria bacterium]|nr:adenylate/guanylate cyclase domain-containing protein [Candidatus Limnocylindria bacterium]